ncbi:hypothetical protein RQP46_004424 [Phenoliferia psychrophenolica]
MPTPLGRVESSAAPLSESDRTLTELSSWVWIVFDSTIMVNCFVRDLQGNSLTFNDATSLPSLRFAVADRTGVPIEEQRLIFGGRQMEDGSLESYGVVDGATISLVLRLRGGGPKKRCGRWLTTTERCSQVSLRIVGDCTFCETSFCGRHRLPEDHACPNLSNCRAEAFERNKSKLEAEMTVGSKGIAGIQGSVAFRLTLGRNPVKLDPGMSLFIPILHSVQKVDMRERALPLERLTAFTSDNVPVTVSATAFYKVVDAYAASFEAQNYETSVLAVGTSALRSTIGKFSYDEIIADRNTLNAALVTGVHQSVSKWGIQVEKMEIQNFHPANANVERQLEQQMEAERNRRKQLLDTQAAINVAEGNKQRTILNSEGELQAKINEAEGEYVRYAPDGGGRAQQYYLFLVRVHGSGWAD